MEKLIEILEEVRPDLDFSTEESLIDGKILDSFDIITIVSELNEEFDIEIGVADLIPQNFNSANAMWALVQKLLK